MQKIYEQPALQVACYTPDTAIGTGKDNGFFFDSSSYDEAMLENDY